MKRNCTRVLSLLLMLTLMLGLLSGVAAPAEAATVDYVYNGKNIYNWGHRGTTATFLSPNAEKFYQKNNITYEALSVLSGSASRDNVSSSELYKALQTLMKKNHTHITDYGETRFLYQYTDCEDSAKVTKAISSFYSGMAIGPGWDSGATWNREHTWPNSKGSGDGENDIMMLRPTSSSENGARGNKAYGESGGYYNPNSESKGQHDLRGDVARIMLYQHVRWAQTSMWGTSGVMESLDVLLKWIAADPVDTWELGRNDSVEAITGTRNVFVDYPELAFLLYNREVPADMTTPSGKAASGGGSTGGGNGGNTGTESYTITAQSSNTAYGSVYLTGTTIIATPANGYQVSGYTIVSGSATVTRNGNTFRVQATSDCTIRINFTPKDTSCKHTNTVTDNGKAPNCTESGYTAGTYCKDCKIYISGHQILNAVGHSYTDTVTPPTPTEDGFTTHTCGACGHSYTDTVVPALGFSYKVTFVTPEGIYTPEEMYCGKDGIYLPEAAKPVTDKGCAFAGWAEKALEETTTAPTLLKAGDRYIAGGDIQLTAVYSYTVDGQTYYASTVTCGHSKTELKGDYKPSCSAAGHTGNTVCLDCGTIVTAGEEIPAKGHSLSKVEEKPATMESTGVAEHFKCSACGKLFNAEGNQITTGDLILDKLTEQPQSPEAPQTPDEPKFPVNTGLLIGGGAAALAIILAIVLLIVKSRKKD